MIFMSYKSGFVLVIIALILLPTTMTTLDKWDKSEVEYKQNCDIETRVMMRASDPIDPELCEELLSEKEFNLLIFLITLSGFMVSSLAGLILILPSSDFDSDSFRRLR
ncbi:MAG: hypothetical protein CMA61_00900 [Euryarchaeota archaeon]|nr:hypothetical protein [Euryarchaeota archaeon]